MEIQHEKELDYRTTFERILSGRFEKIHVTGWDEVEEIQRKEPLLLIRYDQWQTYFDNKYHCTTTKDNKLP
ncbi:hypothetical protein OAW22_06040 [Pseudomonadales bacterium]|jgi:hypothetical protein|nr:hypothetical protein [Pseudomonadales bacterium]